MSNLHGIWIRLPVLAQAIVTGLAVGAAGTLPWAVLVSANMKYAPSLPWAVPIMVVFGNLVALVVVSTWAVWAYAMLATASREARDRPCAISPARD